MTYFFTSRLLFMPSPSRYGHKHEWHPCIEIGINMTVSTIELKLLWKIREIALFTRATPGSSLVWVDVIRPMELDLKCLKMTYWNKTYGIGPVNEIGIRPTDA